MAGMEFSSTASDVYCRAAVWAPATADNMKAAAPAAATAITGLDNRIGMGVIQPRHVFLIEARPDFV